MLRLKFWFTFLGINAGVLCYCRWHSRQGDKFLIQRLGRTDAKERRGNEEVSLQCWCKPFLQCHHTMTSFPSGTSGCFLKRGILMRKRTQSTSTLSFHVCTSISRNPRPFFGARVMDICHLLA